jgi:AraC-like DNA-binding protein
MSAINYDQIAALPVLRRFYHLAWKLFGVNIALVSPDGGTSVVFGSEETISPFCTAVQRHPDLKRRCIACDREHIATAHRTGETLSYGCWAGLREFLIPIRIESPMPVRQAPASPPIAFLQCGQVLDSPPDAAEWAGKRVWLNVLGSDADEIRRLYGGIRVITPDMQQDLVALLELFGNYIAHAQHQLLLAEARRPSRIVERAWSFLREHCGEDISVDAVARAACTSRRNLTRVFSAETGTTVVEALQSLRIERACGELRTTDKTCSGIAFDCGFGSVQQFNRVFRKQTGVTPRVWRSGVGEARPASSDNRIFG